MSDNTGTRIAPPVAKPAVYWERTPRSRGQICGVWFVQIAGAGLGTMPRWARTLTLHTDGGDTTWRLLDGADVVATGLGGGDAVPACTVEQARAALRAFRAA